jgi:hypothetical protein
MSYLSGMVESRRCQDAKKKSRKKTGQKKSWALFFKSAQPSWLMPDIF